MAQDWTAWLLARPLGQWLIAAIGAAIAATGLGIGLAGVLGKFKRRLQLKAQPRRLIAALGSFGFVARAVVFLMIGLFLLFAAVVSNYREAKGFAGALRVIQQHATARPWSASPPQGCSRSASTGWPKASPAALRRRLCARRLRRRSWQPDDGGAGWSMIPKSGYRFSERIMLKQ
jgi:hypothetical protein